MALSSLLPDLEFAHLHVYTPHFTHRSGFLELLSWYSQSRHPQPVLPTEQRQCELGEMGLYNNTVSLATSSPTATSQ